MFSFGILIGYLFGLNGVDVNNWLEDWVELPFSEDTPKDIRDVVEGLIVWAPEWRLTAAQVVARLRG
jgi:hypothetical protein